MRIMVHVPLSVLIMAAAPGDGGTFRGGRRQKKAPLFFFSEERYSAQCCLETSNQTSVAGPQKCADGFSFSKTAEKLED